MPLNSPDAILLRGSWLNRVYWLAVGLLLLFSMVSSQSSHQLVDSFEWVGHSHQVIESVERISFLDEATRSSLRGFLLQSRPRFLQDYRRNLDLLPKEVAFARRLTVDNPRQQQRFELLQRLVSDHRSRRQSILAIALAGDPQKATRLLFSDENGTKHRRFQNEIALIKNEEEMLLGRRRLTSMWKADRLRHVLLAGTLLSLLAMLIARKALDKKLRAARDMALESVRFKSEFMANMSHEIRTPMNAIIGMAELLLETELAPIQKEYVDVFRRAGERLLTVVNDILDFSKVESGVFQLSMNDFNLADLLENTLNPFAGVAEEKGIRLSCHVASDVPPFLSGDSNRLCQIMTNVIGNAIKFTAQGDVLLEIKKEAPLKARLAVGQSSKGLSCRLQFSVTDTGIGIAPNKLHVIFDSFAQEDNSSTRKYGGTGLGLSISKKLVELMGGHMGVASDLGKGARFFFTIPFGAPSEPRSRAENLLAALRSVPDREEQKIQPMPTPSHLSQGVRHPMRILLVEDSADNQMLILEYLKKTHHDVVVAENGEIAVRKATEGLFDLIFMDIQMPVMDGYAATRAIRAWEGQNGKTRAPIPIIALTAYALKEDVEKSLQAGCTDHMTKPIKKTVLLDVIHRFEKENFHAA